MKNLSTDNQSSNQEPGWIRKWWYSSLFYPGLVLAVVLAFFVWKFGRVFYHRSALQSYVQSLDGDIDYHPRNILAPSWDRTGLSDSAVILEHSKLTTEAVREMTNHLEALDFTIALILPNSDVSEVDFSSLASSNRLISIDLTNTSVNGEQLEQLALSTRLDTLILSGTKLTEADWQALTKMTHLRTLIIDSTTAGDQLVPILLKLESLDYLSASNTDLTESALEQLLKKYPNLEVTDD